MLAVTATLAHVRAGKERLPALAPGWIAAVFASSLHEAQKIVLNLTQSGPPWDPEQRSFTKKARATSQCYVHLNYVAINRLLSQIGQRITASPPKFLFLTL